MNEMLQDLLKRVEALEQTVNAQNSEPKTDWRSVVGIMEDNEFTRAMYAEIEAKLEAEREAARRGEFE